MKYDSKSIKPYLTKDASTAEAEEFLQYVERTGLDPAKGHCCMMARWNKDMKAFISKPMAKIDGLRAIADSTGQYKGQTAPQWCGPDGIWTDVWLKKEYPTAARVGIYREGFVEPVYSIALWTSYVQTTKDGDVTLMWHKFGYLMLAKCAEALSLKKAFPQALGGLYTDDEMSQAMQEAPAPSTPAASDTSSSSISTATTATAMDEKKEAAAETSSDKVTDISTKRTRRASKETPAASDTSSTSTKVAATDSSASTEFDDLDDPNPKGGKWSMIPKEMKNSDGRPFCKTCGTIVDSTLSNGEDRAEYTFGKYQTVYCRKECAIQGERAKKAS